jgi:D-alanyl-D-alanine carboxypeptidase
VRPATTELALTPAIDAPHAHGYTILAAPPAVDITGLSPTWGWAAGALVSTADDVARFHRALLTGRLLRRRELREMKTTVSMGEPGERYGLGLWQTRHLRSTELTLPCGSAWGHNGDLPGYTAFVFGTESASRQFVLLVNTDPESMTMTTERALLRVIAHAYCGEPARNRSSS